MTAPASFTLRGLCLLVIRCNDLEAMTAFYCGVLGCTVDRDNREFELRQVRAGDQLIDLIPVDGVLGRRGGAAPGRAGRHLTHFAIRTEAIGEGAIRSERRRAVEVCGKEGKTSVVDGTKN